MSLETAVVRRSFCRVAIILKRERWKISNDIACEKLNKQAERENGEVEVRTEKGSVQDTKKRELGREEERKIMKQGSSNEKKEENNSEEKLKKERG